MKIALFSDVHANMPALEACLKSIDEQKPDAIYCLGDLVGYNVWPNEVIHEIRSRRIATIAGNHDFTIAGMNHAVDFQSLPLSELDKGIVSMHYTNSIIGENEKNYLRMLPLHIRLTFEVNAVSLNLLLVHGSPQKIDAYMHEDLAETDLLHIMSVADADILCFGHTHKPYCRKIALPQKGKKNFRYAINTGSVGKPKDGNTKGSYVLLSFSNKESGQVPDVEVQIVRFDYDVEKAAAAVEESPLSNEFADMLRRGY